MENLTIQEIVKAINGRIEIEGSGVEFRRVSIDSRKIETDSIFIALKGNNFNGNKYVAEASAKGASLCIIDEVHFDRKDICKATSIILVEDCKTALLNLAKYYRSILSVKIVGITGSTGKTSTKDLVAAALSGQYKVFKTEGNFNNEIGLPLMMFQLNKSHDIAVLEMGMSNFGEIHRLADVARPDVAIITNIGVSHIEYLKSRENILKAKLEITDFFNKDNVLIINGENDLLNGVECKSFELIKTGIGNGFNFTGEKVLLEEEAVNFNVIENNRPIEERFHIDVPGQHSVLNALLAIACGRVFKMEYKTIIEGIKSLETTSMRLDIVRGKEVVIIDDCYNASPDSMRAAIDVLINIKSKRKIAVLGTMKELGSEAYKAHVEIGQYAKAKGIDAIFTLGEYNKAFLEGFASEEKYKGFMKNEELIKYILEYIVKEDAILIKASRSMKFEEIVKELKYKKC